MQEVLLKKIVGKQPWSGVLLLRHLGLRPSSNMHLHVVSFDIPWPANYGGVMVVFHQLRALHRLGARIVLHSFEYGGRTPQPILEEYCEAVHYYPRSRSLWQQVSIEPFIVRTRKSGTLLHRLLQDEYPILFEGLHTAGWLAHEALRKRHKIVRMHNIEWQYYRQLAQSAPSLTQRLFFEMESLRLRRAEARLLPFADDVLALSPSERDYFARYPVRTHYLPAFHPYDAVCSMPGSGQYALFHGKCSVPDNERAALWLIEDVFAGLPVPLVVAGMAPSARLRTAAARQPNVRLVADPDNAQMEALIRQAHVHLLYSFQSAGVKLKLLQALFGGRHCVANDYALAGTALHPLCVRANTAAETRHAVLSLMAQPFKESDIAHRRAVLEAHYSNEHNARLLLAIVAGLYEPSTAERV